MLYDTHSHPYLADKKSQNHILENFFSWWGKYLNSISVDLESSQSNIILAKSRQWIFAVIGVHPTHVLEYKDSLDIIFTTLEKLYIENKEYIVWLGETGLDYHCLEKLSENSGVSQEQIVLLQKKVFIWHIHLAKKLWIPIIIHNRDSSEDVFKILKQENFTNFVFHCFSEDLEYAHRLIEFAPQCKLWFW
jgi:TatD DNase family protein